MAVKKGASSASADTTMPPADAVVLQGNGNNSDNVSVGTVADGEHEVNLLDLGISPEDIEAMRRIDARLEEVRNTHQVALEAGPSAPQMTTREKGKGLALSKVE